MVARVLFTTLVLAFGHVMVAASRQCYSDNRGELSFSFPASAMLNSKTGLTAKECLEACRSNDACVVYSYCGNTCAHFDFFTFSTAIDPTRPGSDFIVGRCGSLLPQVKGDFHGNDLANLPAYTWTTYEDGWCWMKTKPSTLSGPSDGTAISEEVFKCREVWTGHDVVGEDLKSVQRADWRDCCGECRRTAGCVASSWSKYNGGTCWLKKTYAGKKTASLDVRMMKL